MKNLVAPWEKDRIDSICNAYNIRNYSINADSSIDVNGDVNLQARALIKLPLKFGKVVGSFNCHLNEMKNLMGSPETVGGTFRCYDNKLTSLEGSPRVIDGDFLCYSMKMTSLLGGPQIVNGVFNCGDNWLDTLMGGPDTVGAYRCYRNNLTTLEGAPRIIRGEFECYYNRLVSTYSGNVDIELGGEIDMVQNQLPKRLKNNEAHIKLILKYQRHFMIWNDDMTLNDDNFKDLLYEIRDGLL